MARALEVAMRVRDEDGRAATLEAIAGAHIAAGDLSGALATMSRIPDRAYTVWTVGVSLPSWRWLRTGRVILVQHGRR
jgi:hypothetical protein